MPRRPPPVRSGGRFPPGAAAAPAPPGPTLGVERGAQRGARRDAVRGSPSSCDLLTRRGQWLGSSLELAPQLGQAARDAAGDGARGQLQLDADRPVALV